MFKSFLKCSVLAVSLVDATIQEVEGREIEGYKCYHDDTTGKYFYWNGNINKSLWPNQMRKLAKDASQLKSVNKKAAHNKTIRHQKRNILERNNGAVKSVVQKNQTLKKVESDSIPPVPSPLTEPHIYLSKKQQGVIKKYHLLKDYKLPAWVPQRLIAKSLGHSDEGMKRALKSTNGKPFLWATEFNPGLSKNMFENVHDLWKYEEPKVTIDGRTYKNSEAYYHAQKPSPFNEKQWNNQKDSVMRKAVKAKYDLDQELKMLLEATKGHPLLSIKNDPYWGFHPQKGGENKLAKIWMELRDGKQKKVSIHESKNKYHSNKDWVAQALGHQEPSAKDVISLGKEVRKLWTPETDKDNIKYLRQNFGRRERFTIGKLLVRSVEDANNALNSAKYTPKAGNGLRFHEVKGDAYDLHRDPANANAVFQAASQFNALEMVNSNVKPSAGITGYVSDKTQGPACAMACPAGTLYRNYFARNEKSAYDIDKHQINLADNLLKLLDPSGQNLKVENGYLLPGKKGKQGLIYIDNLLKNDKQLRKKVKNSIKVAFQKGTQTTANTLVDQVYTSAIDFSQHHNSSEQLARIALAAAFEGTLGYAAEKSVKEGRRVKVFLTQPGGGVFQNDQAWIKQAMRDAMQKYKKYQLDVYLTHFDISKDKQYANFYNQFNGQIH